MAQDAKRALAALAGHAETGALAALCARHAIDLMVVFGSAVRAGADPADLDLAVRFAPRAERDVLTLLDDLYQLTGFEGLDLLVLNDAMPLARERAMVDGESLYQAAAGIFATEQIAAIMQRLDTDRFRELELELMTR